MSLLNTHAEAVDSINAVYHEYLLRYKVNESVVYGFVEGRDDPIFYRGLIERFLPSGWEVELIQSGNKEKVLGVLEQFDWSRFEAKRVCFFIDRDLSDFFEDQIKSAGNLYITDSYSIENEVATFGTFRRLLEEVLNITELSPNETDHLKELFQVSLSRFQEAMTPLMAQILIWRRNGAKPCLNDIQPKVFFKFVDGEILLKAEFKAISSRLQRAAAAVSAVPATEEDLAEAEVEFRGRHGVEKYVRGKYILWFFVQFALEIHRSIHKFCVKHPSSPKVRLSLGPAQRDGCDRDKTKMPRITS